jgi:hypothetical protein
MDRRDFMKSMGVAGGVASGLSAVATNLAGGVAGAAEMAAAQGTNGPASASRDALLGLLDTIRGVQARYLTPEMGVTNADEAAEGTRAIGHLLETALFFWLEAKPERPVFKQYVTPTRKLLGCNPDSLYYFAPIRDDRRYRVTGNVGAATFTSFTIERGSAEGHAARGSIAALSDDEMEIAPDGSFEIIVSSEEPIGKNWLRLEKGASQITTRHYHESRISVGANPNARIELRIEPLDRMPLEPHGGDSEIGAHFEWIANFVREHAAMMMTPTSPEMAKQLGWVSTEPNRLPKPGQWISASGEMAYGNTHAYYASAPFELAPDEALLLRGRFPDCRFANVVLWNRYMQSFDYANRQISLNRSQIQYQEDGSFEIVVAHSDPGVPNWLDTEGRATGTMYWRYIFPTETPQRVNTKIVKHESLGR